MNDFSTMGEDDDVDGDVLGDVLGDDFATVGARRMALRARARKLLLGPRPAWRSQVAPGVARPGEGLEPLPLRPDNGTGVFTAAIGSIQWEAQPQRPFRPERLLASVGRSGASAAGLLVVTQAIVVGAMLGQADIGPLNLESFAPGAFGVRLSLPAMTPGMRFTVPATLTGALVGADTIAVTITLLGRVVR